MDIEKLNNLPLVEKYRPTKLDNIICQNHIVHTIKQMLLANTLSHMIFYGPPGTGKTSTILACVNEIYDSNQFEVINLNASDERGIDVVRQRIYNFVESQTLFKKSNFKIVILDEADSMTEDAQYSLRQIIMNYTDNVRFCIICNYINRIIPALQSRCCKFRYIPIPKEYIVRYLINICNIENIQYDLTGIEAINNVSGGDLRKSLNLLQTIHLVDQHIIPENVHRISNYPDKKCLNNIIKILLTDNLNNSYTKINEILYIFGFPLQIIIELVATYFTTIFTQNNIEFFKDLAQLERTVSLKYYNNNNLIISFVSIFHKLLVKFFRL